MLREIVKKGDEVLNKKCHAVTKFDDKLHTLLDDMADTLRDADGVGLAAPQVGILRQLVLVINEDDEIIELINPEIIQTSGEQFGLEDACPFPDATALSNALWWCVYAPRIAMATPLR